MPQLGQQLFCSVVVFVSLYLLSYFSVIAGDAGVIVLFTGLSIALASVLFIRARLKRAFVVAAALNESTPVRPFVKGGVLLFTVQLLFAVPMAASLLIVLSQGFSVHAWLALLTVLLLWLLIRPRLIHVFSHHLSLAAQAYFAFRISVLSALLLAMLIVLPMAFLQSFPDLTHLSWHEVLDYAKGTVLARSELLKSATTLWQSVDYFRIWLAQQLSIGQSAIWLKLAVWLVVLVQNLLFVLPIILLMQGANVLADKASMRYKNTQKQQLRFFAVSCLIVSAVLWLQIAEQPWQWFSAKQAYIVLDGETYKLDSDDLDEGLQHTLALLSPKRQAAHQQLLGQMDKKLNLVFTAAEQRIPDYLDWHYSMKGLGQRFLLQMLSNNVENPFSKILFPPKGFDAQLVAIEAELQAEYQQAQKLLNSALVEQLKLLFADKHPHPHKPPPPSRSVDVQQLLDQLMLERIQASKAATQVGQAMLLAGGTVAIAHIARGQIAKQLATKGGQKAAQQAAAQTTKAVSLRAVGHSIARFSPVGCMASGPWFSVCTGLSFLATGVVMEKGILMYDEYYNRDDLEQQTQVYLNELQEQIMQLYSAQLMHMLKDNSEEVRQRVQSKVRAVDYL